MVRKQRLGHEDRQEMTEDVRFRDIGVAARRIEVDVTGQPDTALQVFKRDLDPPAQPIEIANLGGRELGRVERRDQDHPFGRDGRLQSEHAALVDGRGLTSVRGLGKTLRGGVFRLAQCGEAYANAPDRKSVV